MICIVELTRIVCHLSCRSLSGELQQVDVAGRADGKSRFQSLAIVVQTEDALRQLNQLSRRLYHATKKQISDPQHQWYHLATGNQAKIQVRKWSGPGECAKPVL